jgi:hypothetical protein
LIKILELFEQSLFIRLKLLFMNQIKLKSIGELIRSADTNEENKVEHYLIPDYQRGYRWKAEEHVKALLDDIDTFINKEGRCNDEIYCLQPIVVAPQNNAWEVIDGQQRLTTLYLILKALKKEKIYEVSYTHRHESTSVLLNPMLYRDDMPDHYFICKAYKFIEKWFENKETEIGDYKEAFSYVLTRNVKVIWYKVDLNEGNESEKIDIFNRLNIGKIPLDDAELIRALFIQHITTSGSEREKAIEQSIFSNSWNEIETFLQNEEVWGFLQSKEDKKYANRILKLFEIVAQKENSEGRATFLWFENELKTKKAEELWENVKTYFGKIRYWFNDYERYHLIGLLVQIGIPLKEICNHSDKVTKSAFKEWLQTKVKEKFKPETIDELEYGKDNSKIEYLLLLFNVLSAIETQGNQNLRFPFHRYTKTSWSLEHINAQHSDDPMKDIKYISIWVNETVSELENINHLENPTKIATEIDFLKTLRDKIKEEPKKQLSQSEIASFNNVREKIEAFFITEADGGSTEESMHTIENLALLSGKDNSSLNNAIFPVKSKKIFQLEKEGSFIPQCTKNVFLKVYSKSYTPPYRWSKQDREDYISEIKRVFNDYFKEDRNNE